MGLTSTISARLRVTRAGKQHHGRHGEGGADEDHAAHPRADPGGALDRGEQRHPPPAIAMAARRRSEASAPPLCASGYSAAATAASTSTARPDFSSLPMP